MATAESEVERSLAAKVAAHDHAIESLTRNMDNLMVAVEKQRESIQDQGDRLNNALQTQTQYIQKDIQALNAKFSEARTISWPLLVSLFGSGIAAIAVTITIMTIIGSLALAPIETKLTQRTRELGFNTQLRMHSLQSQNNLMHQQTLLMLNQTRRESNLPPFDMPKFWPQVPR